MHEFQSKLLDNNYPISATFKNALAEKYTNGERLGRSNTPSGKFENVKFKRETGFLFLAATNHDSFNVGQPVRDRLSIVQCPVNKNTEKEDFKWENWLNNDYVKEYLKNRKKLSHMISMVSLYLKCFKHKYTFNV